MYIYFNILKQFQSSFIILSLHFSFAKMISRVWWILAAKVGLERGGTAVHDPRRRSIALRLTSERVCTRVDGQSSRALPRSAQFALHLLQIGLPSFLARAHATRRVASLGISRESAAGFLRNRITACDACPARSALLPDSDGINKRNGSILTSPEDRLPSNVVS